jgi:hypothetical protein
MENWRDWKVIDSRRAMEIMGMKGKPARNRSDIDKQGYLSNWNPIDADWKKRINQFWWGTGYCGRFIAYA